MERAPVVVLTGSSSGIGLHVALQLSQKNYTVIATLRNPAKAPPSLRESSCDIQALDVTDDGSTAGLASYVQDRYGGCDILINNAGFGIPGSLEAITIDAAKRVFEVNVWGVVRMCQKFVPQMRARGGGLVLVVSSTSGVRGVPCADSYTASKMAIQGMMDSFRYSVEQDNIKVTLVNPGPVITRFASRYLAEEDALKDGSDPHPALTKYYTETIAGNINEGQTVESCAEAIVQVTDREFVKSVADGKEEVCFLNGTSDAAKQVVDGFLRYPDGHTGPYADMWRDARASVEHVRQQEQAAKRSV